MHAAREHPLDVPPVGVVTTTTAVAIWIALLGELDLANADQLEQSLTGLSLTRLLPIHLDLSRLSFCDGRGLGLLLDFSTWAERRGHRVRTHGARPTVRKLAWLLSNGRTDFDESLGLA
ncbi:MAG: STAS domain-containing protein [Nocardioidaceae bacterium]